MPYILPGHRYNMDSWIELLSNVIHTKGELNYAITRLCVLYLKTYKQSGRKVGYEERTLISGVLHDALTEWDRRIVAPYEDTKCEENGDVYSDLD